jgi:ABC-type nitrate/sulfonate/bicarbonate transport system substrate-binding protein
VQLKWLHQAQFAGNYVAKEKGFYQREGIEISNFYRFDFNSVLWPIDQVENKEVEFAITGGEELIKAKAEGKADHVKAIAVIYRTNPACLYSLKESGIVSPKDLIGKTIGIERAEDGTDTNVGILYQTMLKRMGIDRSKMKEVSIGYNADELLQGKTDVSSGYVTNEPQQVIEAGKEVNVILMAEYGANLYADVLITHDDLIESNPRLVEGFVRATIDGWYYALEHEDEALDVILKYAPESNRPHQRYMLQQSSPLISNGEERIGVMKSEEWQKGITLLKDAGIIKGEVNVDDLYTSRFVQG